MRAATYHIHCLRLIFFVFLLPVFAGAQSALLLTLDPVTKTGQFNSKSPVKFRLQVANKTKTDLKGTISYVVTTLKSVYITDASMPAAVGAGKTIDIPIDLSIIDGEGFYELVVRADMGDVAESVSNQFGFTDLNKVKKKAPEPAPVTEINYPQAGVKPALQEATVAEEAHSEGGDEEEEGEIVTVLKPTAKDAMFGMYKPVKYTVVLHNKYNQKQEGSFSYYVTTEKGEQVYENRIPVVIPKKYSKQFSFEVPVLKGSGVYNFKFCLNLSTYDDTTTHAFVFNAEKVNSELHKPGDFDDFWDETIKELDKIDPRYSIVYDPSKSTVSHKTYRVDFTSFENVRVFGWLTIPKLRGKFPLILGFGGHKIEVFPLFFPDFAVFTVNVRGIGESMRVINPKKETYVTLHMNDRNKYVYRGLYMDCLRAADFLFTGPHGFSFDLSRVAVFGGSQGASQSLVTVALAKKRGYRFGACIADNPVMTDIHQMFDIADVNDEIKFPIKEFEDYIEEHKGMTREDVLNVWQYFEVQNFMTEVNCPVLYACSLLDPYAPPGCVLGAYNKLPKEIRNKSELYVFAELGHEVTPRYNTFKSNWFYEKLVSVLK
jgi:cephalosporin-C deacetylase